MSQPESTLASGIHSSSSESTTPDITAFVSSKRPRDYDLDPSEFSSDDEAPAQVVLVRQDAKTGNDLLTAVSRVSGTSIVLPPGRPKTFKICGRKLTGKNAGKKCQRPVERHGMCRSHLAQWKRKNPWLISPGHY